MRRTPGRRPAFVAVLSAVLLLAGACGSTGPSAGGGPAPSTSTPAAAFPATVGTDNGPVTIERPPQRIVSLSASLTEMLFAVGAGSQVVAVDDHSNHPAGTPMTKLSGFRPNVEAVAGYQPDLVVLASDRSGVVASLAGLGVPTVVLSSPDHVADVYDQIAAIGGATGHAQEAAQVVADMRTQLAGVVAAAPERRQPASYFYELSSALHTVSSTSFLGELLGMVGLTSVADGVDPAAGAFPQLSSERVLSANPSVIFLAHTDGTPASAAVVAGRPGWAELDAVRSGRVVTLDPDVAARWGPRIVELLRAVVAAAEQVPAT